MTDDGWIRRAWIQVTVAAYSVFLPLRLKPIACGQFSPFNFVLFHSIVCSNELTFTDQGVFTFQHRFVLWINHIPRTAFLAKGLFLATLLRNKTEKYVGDFTSRSGLRVISSPHQGGLLKLKYWDFCFLSTWYSDDYAEIRGFPVWYLLHSHRQNFILSFFISSPSIYLKLEPYIQITPLTGSTLKHNMI